MPFSPIYQISPATARALIKIEALRVTLSDELQITPDLIASLHESARLLSTHFSTKIEGNRLTAEEVAEVIVAKRGFPGRQRDEQEVLHHFRAAEHMEQFARSIAPITEQEIQTIHGLVMNGKPKPTPYRDGQNVIRDGETGQIVYMPPEAHDVPSLMGDLVDWANHEIESEEIPAPVIAALAHYQFATIHPYYDGNGRTARLMTNLILHRSGYGLNGIYSLEEYYAKNLGGYYRALSVGESHNYYLGRAECDVSEFVEYFCVGMAHAFERVAENVAQHSQSASSSSPHLIRELSPLQRQSLGLFRDQRVVTAKELANYLSIDTRKAGRICLEWVEQDFLVIHNESKKNRSYCLSEKYESNLMG